MENDSITKYSPPSLPTPPPPGRKAVTAYAPSQLELYRGLPTNCSISTMVSAKTPTIAQIKNNVSLDDARALLSIAVCELCDFFNVGKNMNDTQIALTVDIMLERYWYLRLEEIKFCFRRAMAREKLFDRLDGNIILGWLAAYDTERTAEAMRLSEQEDSENFNAPALPQGSEPRPTVLEQLRRAADEGLPGAAEAYENLSAILSRPESEKTQQQKDQEFRQWKLRTYLPARDARKK